MTQRTSTDDVTARSSPAGEPAPDGLFSRIVCGVDETPESLEAVRQAGHLLEKDGAMQLISVCDLALAAQGGWMGTGIADRIEDEAREALAAAAHLAPQAEARLVTGDPVATILAAADSFEADLIALGTHGRSRAARMALGTVATSILHKAKTSVLFAHRPLFVDRFPVSIVAGIDGSPPSLAAASIGGRIAARTGASLRVVLAAKGHADVDAARAAVPDLVVDHRSPVAALRAAGADADLLVIGSRGLRGLRSLGSVSERVAHGATCSTLVVRGPEA